MEVEYGGDNKIMRYCMKRRILILLTKIKRRAIFGLLINQE
jgi:hypothetical protein